MGCKEKCPCRIGLDWISGVIEIISLVFFLSGFGTKYWAVSDDGSVHSGLFSTCTTDIHTLCYDTHNYYHSSSAKGRVMAAGVFEMLTTCGYVLVLLFMLLYMCGLYEEKIVGRLAAISAYVTGFLGFLGVILFGAGANMINFSVGYSVGLVIIALILNLVAGIFIHLGSSQFVEFKLFHKSAPPKFKTEFPPINQKTQLTSRFPKLKMSA